MWNLTWWFLDVLVHVGPGSCDINNWILLYHSWYVQKLHSSYHNFFPALLNSYFTPLYVWTWNEVNMYIWKVQQNYCPFCSSMPAANSLVDNLQPTCSISDLHYTCSQEREEELFYILFKRQKKSAICSFLDTLIFHLACLSLDAQIVSLKTLYLCHEKFSALLLNIELYDTTLSQKIWWSSKRSLMLSSLQRFALTVTQLAEILLDIYQNFFMN